MSDYIKREDVVNLGVMMQTHLWTREQTYNAIFCLPSADVAPVRHGRWVDVDRMQMHDLHGVLTWGNSFKCTECQFKTFAVEGHITQYKYCPNCGAKMDEGEDNED